MIPRCDWFQREGALALERGELDSRHLATCASCQAEHRSYLAIAQALGALSARSSPPSLPPSERARRLEHLLAAQSAARGRLRLGIAIAVAITSLAAAAALSLSAR